MAVRSGVTDRTVGKHARDWLQRRPFFLLSAAAFTLFAAGALADAHLYLEEPLFRDWAFLLAIAGLAAIAIASRSVALFALLVPRSRRWLWRHRRLV